MATNRRDIELLISARETTGRSFKQVTDNIDALNRKIGEQVAAAERGEVSLQELRQTQEQLASAGRDLSAIQGQIDAYNRLVLTSEKVSASAEKAKADLAAMQAQIEANGSATAAQEQKLQRLERAVVSTGAALDKNTSDLAEQTASLKLAGVATEQLETAQAGVVNTARQIGAGLVQVNAAIDGYAANVTAAKTAEQQLAAQQGFERKIAEAQRLGQASKFVQLFGDAINTVRVADNQLSALTGFRAVGQMAVEAANDVDRFSASGQKMAITASQVAAGLRAILDPGGAAIQTLGGVEAAIEKADTQAAEGVKNVGLLNDAYNNLSAASAALLRQGGLVDTFQQQAAATEAARTEFQLAQADVQKLGAAMAQADEPTEQLANALHMAETRLNETGHALSVEEGKLSTMGREMLAAGIDTNQLAAAQNRLTAAATRAGAAMGRINQTLGRGGVKTNGFFGLKPNELTNLSYQINDIFVSLASGQNPLIVLVQQGSQIGQLFPGLISTVARFAAAWAPVIIAVTVVGLALRELYTDAARLKQVTVDLAANPLGAGLDASKIAAAQEKMEDLGASAEDAHKAMQSLSEQGFSTDQIVAYSKAASQLAERLGVDVVQATQLLVDVQQGGIDTVYALAEKTNDLTNADLNHVEALFKAGKAAEARIYALDRVKDREAQIAKLTDTAWTPAVNNLKTAWNNFTGWLGSVLSPWLDRLNLYIAGTIAGITFLSALLAGKGLSGANADANSAITSFYSAGKKPWWQGEGRGASDQEIRDRKMMNELDEEELQNSKALTSAERLRLTAQKARLEAQEKGVSKAVEERAVAQAIAKEQAKINKENKAAGRRAQSLLDKQARAAKAEQARRDAAQKQLDQQLRQLDRAALTGASASLAERLEAIDEKYQNIYDSVKKLRDLGLSSSSDGTNLNDVEKHVEATKQRLKDEETIKYYQEQAGLLAKQRDAELQQVNDARERGAISVTTAMENAAEITGRISPQIVEAAKKAYDLAHAISETNPSPEMVSWIAALDRIISNEGIDNSVAEVGLAGFDQLTGKLDTLLKERDDLVAGFSTLNDLGLKSTTQTRALIAQVYTDQATAIQPVLDKLRETVEALHNTRDALSGLPLLTDTAYATWLAKIDAVNAGLTQTTTKLSNLETNTLQGLATAGVNVFNAFTTGLAGAIAGTESWGDAFANVGVTILQGLADITAAIGQAIIKFLILRALEGAAGLPPGTLTGGGGGGVAGSFFGLFHEGGIVGSRGGSRQRRMGMNDNWAGAPKFHGGGGLGLQPGEYKAVLKRGEEVLTEDNPRHINNAGGGDSSAAPNAIKQVLLFDQEEIPRAMQTKSGQRAVLTIIKANKTTLKQMLS